jgi:hypothetical protein
LVAGVVLSLVVTLGQWAAAPRRAVAAPPAKAACPSSRPDRPSALLTARWCGGRVEVAGEESETTQVWANPDGTLQAEVASGPVRVRDSKGAWAPVDLTLVAQPDGSVVSRTHPVGLRLSGAQAADAEHDLAALGTGPDAVTVGWRGKLPAPVLSGTTATYVDALPGVDVLVEAVRTGFEYSLRVKDRAALARVASVPMRVTSARLSTAGAAGGLVLKGRNGVADARLPQPRMWDARVGANSGEPLHVATVGMKSTARAGGVDLTLTPDPAFAADPGLQFPVTIDPSATVGAAWDTWVQTGTATSQSGSTELKLGFEDDGPALTARSFLIWPTGMVAGAQITSATMYLWEFHSWSCTATNWQVWATGAVVEGTVWSNQPPWNTLESTSSQTRGYSSACNDGWVAADARGFFQDAANVSASGWTMGIRAQSESDHNGWKKFNSMNAAANVPYAVVTFNSAPSVTSRSTTPSTQCVSGSGRPFVNTATPTLAAQVADPEGSPVTATFEWWTTGGGLIGSTTTGSQASGSSFTATVPAGVFVNGGTYSWRVRGSDGSSTGTFSLFCEFTVDTTAPAAAPGVSSAALPNNTWTGAPPVYTLTTATQAYVDGTTTLPLTGDDAVQQVDLPFALPFFNLPHSSVWVDTDGTVAFADPGGPIFDTTCDTLPSAAVPAGLLLPFCDDLTVDGLASVRTATTGTAPNRKFVIDWHNVARVDDTSERINFEVLLGEDATITYNYSSLDNADEQGGFAVVGLEDATGSQGVLYTQDLPALANTTALIFHPTQAYTTGYTATAATRTYTPAGTVLGLSGDDNYAAVALPFPVGFYGNSYRQVWVDTNGQLDFVNRTAATPTRCPSPTPRHPTVSSTSSPTTWTSTPPPTSAPA